MGVRSNNPTQSFFDDFFRSGKDAVNLMLLLCLIRHLVVSLVIMKFLEHIIERTFLLHQGSFVSPGDKSIEYIAVAGGGGAGFSHPGAGRRWCWWSGR